MPFSRKVFSAYYCLFFSGAVVAETSVTDLSPVPQCLPPAYPQLAPGYEAGAGQTIKIVADHTSLLRNQVAKFTGDVTLINEEHRIKADELEVNRQSESFNAKGNIHFQNNMVNVFANALDASDETQSTQLTKTSYQLVNSPGKGEAGAIIVNKDGELSMIDSTYTACLGEVPDWQIKAAAINLSVEENYVEAYHARLKLFGVPVFYLPYFNYPVTNERKSGLLEPQFSSSGSSGVEVAMPFYWNIAENLDATITPRYMSKRGMQLLTEFRYLADLQSGKINLEYLNKDDELNANNDPRYLARYQHSGTFSDRFRAYIDYTTISDDNYLVDIGSEEYKANDAYLYQVGELSYFGENWQTTFKLQDFEVLGNHQHSYKTLPQIEIASQQPLPLLNGQFEVYSELTRFETPNKAQPKANRYHVEAGFNFPLTSPAWFLNSELKVLQTYYQQEDIAESDDFEETVSRTLPKIRFHGGINFDRDLQAFGKGLTQTFEPQLQYLYIPDKDQSDIAVYDTARLQDDYNGLFRDRRYSGLDRIAHANQVSWGVTSRILSRSHQELFRASLGGIVYLNDSNFAADDTLGISANKSALAADLFYRINHQWQLSGDIQYNTTTNVTDKSQVNLDYQFNENQLIQLNHRYSRNVSDSTLEQISLLGSTSIDKNWTFVGRITQDLQQNRSIESYAGLEYESCCWRVRFIYQRQINTNIDEQDFINENRDEFNSGFMIKFQKGFGGQDSTVGRQDMFNSSIFGYKRPYFLNN
ncbi:LPS-assembly protein LptD [Thalassomonas actiniarum]|uniref:LPS-assembly protein LptD n=1 Tax=Thalassomonas actiniarum TaxID=485447 RepID=A0AAE9YRJ3_9GAMM|nr:LPS assembly protein LptD [Thalassomonas actiniarum]WDD99571.1 LPS assembly protein LptD [Thalassomonas actiniarum]